MKAKYLLILLIPIFIISFNLNFLIFNYNFYNNNDVNDNLLNYFKDKEELKFNYTEREYIHLNDVKSLINILEIIVYVLLLLILIIIFYDFDIEKILIISGLITIGIIFILVIFNFGFLFTKFHEVLFVNDYWLLPEDSLLIKTYPIEFFTGFFKRLVLNIGITSLIVIVLGILKNVHTKHKSSAN